MISKIAKRYELRKGKFGCFFHDNFVMVDMNLEMVLNRLNRSESNRESQLRTIKNLQKEVFNLKWKDVNKLKEVNVSE